jgi:hypothetical protein
VDELRRASGTAFDPDLVALFLSIVERLDPRLWDTIAVPIALASQRTGERKERDVRPSPSRGRRGTKTRGDEAAA